MDIFGNFSALRGEKKKRKVSFSEESDFRYQDITLEGQSRIEEAQTSRFSIYLKVITSIIFIILGSKLFFLQVIDASKSFNLAEDNRIRPRSILSSRGVVTDSKGVWLARNKPSFALGVYPSDLPRKKAEREKLLKTLSMLANMPQDEIEKKIESNGSFSIDLTILKPNLPREEALILEEEIADLPGVIISKRAIREYKSDAGLAHIMGYTGIISSEEIAQNPDYLMSEEFGKAGIEKYYQSELRGDPGIEQVEVDSRGRIIQVLKGFNNLQPVGGNNLSLNIDYDLQQKMTEKLVAGIQGAGPEVSSGVAIAMNPNTGAILGMVSVPYYDNNIFGGEVNSAEYSRLLKDSSLPLLNRATMGIYPPGSIIKIVTAAAGLQEGVITKNTSIETPQEIVIGEWRFPDWKYHAGMSNVTRAIAESNNIFFYAVGGGWDKIKGLGPDSLKNYLSMFGFGAKSGVDLPSEASGLVPGPEWKENYKNEKWYLGNTYQVAIGQGDLLVTPLQMTKALSAIANGGRLLAPQLVKEVTNVEGDVVKDFSIKVERDNFISAEHISTVQQGMREAVLYGSGRILADLPVSSAAKTGTAQFFNNQKTHAWFECYAPYENPEIAIVVLVEGGGGGYEIASPIAREILSWYFSR
jgi:penicillin-binding protein 2